MTTSAARLAANMDLTVDYAMPHRFGILTCENKGQAWERADLNSAILAAEPPTPVYE